MDTAPDLDRCTAWHHPHDCRAPGACRAALLAMLADVDERARRTFEERNAQAAAELAELARCHAAAVEAIDPDPTPPHGTERPNTTELPAPR